MSSCFLPGSCPHETKSWNKNAHSNFKNIKRNTNEEDTYYHCRFL